MATEFRRMQQRRGSAAQWASNDTVLLPGEIGLQTGPGTGEARAKVGDGTTLFSELPWVFEVDQTARDQIFALDAQVVSLDSRVTVVEEAIAGGGSIASLIAQVDANTAAIAGLQPALLPGEPGDLLWWSEEDEAWIPLPAGDDGQVLSMEDGEPTWVTPPVPRLRVLALAGGAAVQDAFNALAPTILSGDTTLATWSGDTYAYVGPAGTAITTAVAGDFVAI